MRSTLKQRPAAINDGNPIKKCTQKWEYIFPTKSTYTVVCKKFLSSTLSVDKSRIETVRNQILNEQIPLIYVVNMETIQLNRPLHLHCKGFPHSKSHYVERTRIQMIFMSPVWLSPTAPKIANTSQILFNITFTWHLISFQMMYIKNVTFEMDLTWICFKHVWNTHH